jgi:hypothetical protein
MATGEIAGRTAVGWGAIAPVCVACTVTWVWHAAAGVGLLVALTWAHYVGLVGAFVMAGVVLATRRHHRRRLPTVLVALGIVPLLWHVGLHVAGGEAHHSLAFDLTNQVAITLLSAAVFANLWSSRVHRTARESVPA